MSDVVSDMAEVIEARPETRRRRKAERPKEILDAAFFEFSRHGYAVTTLDQIAERAGVTKGTIYVYFANKEHLFISMVRAVKQTALDTVHDMFERHDGSTADLLRAQFSFIYQHIVEDKRRREVVRMLIAEAERFPELADRYHEEILSPCLDMLKQAIQRGIDRGEIRCALAARWGRVGTTDGRRRLNSFRRSSTCDGRARFRAAVMTALCTRSIARRGFRRSVWLNSWQFTTARPLGWLFSR